MDRSTVRILLIDDDADVLKSLSLMLRSRGYLNVETAAGSGEGLQKLAASSYDLVLLDMIMPKVNGWGVLEQIRSSGVAIRIIVVSAVGLPMVVRQELTQKYNKVDFVSKTQIVGELEGRIAEALSRPAEPI